MENSGNVNLLYRTVHAANQLCIYGAVSKGCGPNSGEASQSRPERVRKMSPETQIKQEDLKLLVDIPRLPHASGKRMLQNFKDFNSMPFMRAKLTISVEQRKSTIRSRKETSMSQPPLMMTDGESTLRCAKNIQRPETERIQSHTHQFMQRQK